MPGNYLYRPKMTQRKNPESSVHINCLENEAKIKRHINRSLKRHKFVNVKKVGTGVRVKRN